MHRRRVLSQNFHNVSTMSSTPPGFPVDNRGGCGGRRKRKKLSDRDVDEIRRYALEGISQTAIAVRYRVHPSTVNQIVRWKQRTSPIDTLKDMSIDETIAALDTVGVLDYAAEHGITTTWAAVQLAVEHHKNRLTG